MARGQDESSSLRFSRRERERLMAALLFSLLVHLVIGSVYYSGTKLGWWKKWHSPWARPETKQASLALLPKIQPPAQSNPDIFVDVSHADADAPEKTKFYSNKNSHAANADTADANVPKINGRQTDAPMTEDARRPVKTASETAATEPKETAQEPVKATTQSSPTPQPLQPAQPTPPEATPTETQEPLQTPGETDLRKPQKALEPAQAQQERPRTIRKALAQQHQTPGVPMQQAGGVARRALWSSLDAKATPFGEYDSAIVEAIQQRWYDLLDSHQYAQDRSGKVTLKFKLRSDGSVIEMQTLENTVGDLLGYLCQESIEESAPFAKWPPDMVRMVGANYREVSFTFYYY